MFPPGNLVSFQNLSAFVSSCRLEKTMQAYRNEGVKMLTKFLLLKNIEDFPFTHFGQFLSSFVDDLACFTKKRFGRSYSLFVL